MMVGPHFNEIKGQTLQVAGPTASIKTHLPRLAGVLTRGRAEPLVYSPTPAQFLCALRSSVFLSSMPDANIEMTPRSEEQEFEP